MARENFTPGINRRKMLVATAAVTATGVAPALRRMDAKVMPNMASAVTASVTPAYLPALNLTGDNARRLAEIARRNLIRHDARLPVLSVTTELRKLYRRDRETAFARFAAVHRSAVKVELLAARRLAKGDATWQPRGFFEGVSFENQVQAVLRGKFLLAINAEGPEATA